MGSIEDIKKIYDVINYLGKTQKGGKCMFFLKFSFIGMWYKEESLILNDTDLNTCRHGYRKCFYSIYHILSKHKVILHYLFHFTL